MSTAIKQYSTDGHLAYCDKVSNWFGDGDGFFQVSYTTTPPTPPTPGGRLTTVNPLTLNGAVPAVLNAYTMEDAPVMD